MTQHVIGLLLWGLVLGPWVVLVFGVLYATSGPDKPADREPGA